ncbi:hypothetical protein M0805_004352 [Coniferiporia weirii]|nr:hypothetical protein M0805_004352 [Coniferiporia weirii]
MAPSAILLERSSDPSTSAIKSGTSIPTTAIAGFCVAAVLVLSVSIWLGVSFYRKRERRKREEKRGSAFLTVKGVVKESSLGVKGTGFSRANLTNSIILPERAIIRPDATPEEILDYHSENGSMPRPFAPFSFALNMQGHAPSPSSTPPASPGHAEFHDNRVSTLSFSVSAARLPGLGAPPHSALSSARSSLRSSFLSARASVLSTASSLRSGGSGSGGAGVQTRVVRQVFTPILPDEPVLALAERVAVLRSFDDGWCIIARARPHAPSGQTELGAVPAWCFVRPMKGLRPERPVRSSSLGVTVQLDALAPDRPRDDIISWSNF